MEKIKKMSSKLSISDVIDILPTKDEINNESETYNHEMTSIAEGIWMPEGFREGAKWVIEKLINNINNKHI